MKNLMRWLPFIPFVIWCAAILGLTWWTRKPGPAWYVGAFIPWLIGASAVLFVAAVFLLFSSRRLFWLSATSLIVASVIIAFWIGSMRTLFGSRLNAPSRTETHAGTDFDVNKTLSMFIAAGGISFDWRHTMFPHLANAMVFPKWTLSLIKYGREARLEHPAVQVGWKPIPAYGGFDSDWFTATSAIAAGSGNPRARYFLLVPFWFPVLLCGFFPALYICKLLKERRRIREDRCLCGYQLSGTPANPDGTRRCSECGRINPPAMITASAIKDGAPKPS
jgi:hypothetical protein